MRKLFLMLYFFALVLLSYSDRIKIGGDQRGMLSVDTGQWQYTFRLKDNILISLARNSGEQNLLADIKGGGGHWIYVTGSGGGNDSKTIFRQGEHPVTASYEILTMNETEAVIRLTTILGALRINDVYVFESQIGVVTQRFEIEALEMIPNFTLLSWQAKMGTEGSQKGPFDWFLWGQGANCIVRDEDKLKTDATLLKSGIQVDTRQTKSMTYWLDPKSMDNKFIAMLSRDHNQFWLMTFPADDKSPWYFWECRSRCGL